jgi:hypothetical protein
MRPHKKLFALAVSTSLTLMPMLAGTALASAPLSSPTSANAHPTSTSHPVTTADAGTATPLTTITCNLKVDYPHKSTHDPSTVNVEAEIICTAPVTELSMTVVLYRTVCDPTCHAVQWGTPGQSVTYGSATLSGNSAGPCSNGLYYGYATGSIAYPPNYYPPTGSVFGNGSTQTVSTC